MIKIIYSKSCIKEKTVLKHEISILEFVNRRPRFPLMCLEKRKKKSTKNIRVRKHKEKMVVTSNKTKLLI